MTIDLYHYCGEAAITYSRCSPNGRFTHPIVTWALIRLARTARDRRHAEGNLARSLSECNCETSKWQHTFSTPPHIQSTTRKSARGRNFSATLELQRESVKRAPAPFANDDASSVNCWAPSSLKSFAYYSVIIRAICRRLSDSIDMKFVERNSKGGPSITSALLVKSRHSGTQW